MRLSKRLLDISASLLGLAALSPLLALAAICVWLDDGRPIFFLQTRVGRQGRLFRMLKFRTMAHHQNPGQALITIGRDPRITRSGYWLRRSKVDELPQLWNVLIGEMSLVGPRPEVEKYVSTYSDAQRQVLEHTPGITDPASIAFRNESEILATKPDPETFYREELLPRKLTMSVEYADRATLFSDLQVILETLFGSKLHRKSD